MTDKPNTMERYLLIGGSADGEMMETGGLPIWLVASVEGCFSDGSVAIKHDKYLRHEFRFGDRRYTLYLFHTLQPSELFDIFLKKYQTP